MGNGHVGLASPFPHIAHVCSTFLVFMAGEELKEAHAKNTTPTEGERARRFMPYFL
jgi:hypothetical protein